MGLFKRKEKEEKLSRGEQFNQDANEYLDFVHSLGPNANPTASELLDAFLRMTKDRNGGEPVEKNELDYYMADNGSLWESEEAYKKFLESSKAEKETLEASNSEEEEPVWEDAPEEDIDVLTGLTEPIAVDTLKYTDPEGNEWGSEADYLHHLQQQLEEPEKKEEVKEEEIPVTVESQMDENEESIESQDNLLPEDVNIPVIEEEDLPEITVTEMPDEEVEEQEPVVVGTYVDEFGNEWESEADYISHLGPMAEGALKEAAYAVQMGEIPNPEIPEEVLEEPTEEVENVVSESADAEVATTEEVTAEGAEPVGEVEEIKVEEEPTEIEVPTTEETEQEVEEPIEVTEEVAVEEVEPAGEVEEIKEEEPTEEEVPTTEETEQEVEEPIEVTEEVAVEEVEPVGEVEEIKEEPESAYIETPAIEEIEQEAEEPIEEVREEKPPVYVDSEGNQWEEEAAYLAHQAEVSHLVTGALERTERIGGEEMGETRQEDQSTLSTMVSQVMELNQVNEAKQQYLSSLQKANEDLKRMITLLTEQQQTVEEEIKTLAK